MAKKPKAESLALDDLGNLESYEDDELARLREKLIADVERIQAESSHHAKRISELNQARNELQREQAERARALRAVKHTLHMRARELQPMRPLPRIEQKRSVAPRAARRA